MHANIRLAGELGTALGNFASVFGIKDVLQNLVSIGGQLENQRIALGAILQDGGKATEMFSKIQSLAVKSPFGIMDLNQYTKQLSAYSIPYNELYDTMKRLADISAGVGVDMGRIVLAFGQVRAAGFLKGTELRQFTEANIPMVDKLAERFSNLEKRIVSAGEVYDMISKKKVTFEDVKSVLWDLTGEGGMFNNMQEVLSESLASKWKNLADAIDVMYGKIADGMIGSGLKSLAELLTELTKNWEYLATAIGSAAASYGLFKLASNRQFSNTKALYDNTLSIKRQQASSLLLTKTYRELTRVEQQLVATTDRLTIADVKRLVRTKQLNKEEALRLIAMKKLDAATESYVARLYGLDAKMITTAKNATWFSRAFATASGALKSFGLALKGLVVSPWTWVTLGITAITELFIHYSKKQDEIEERNKNFAESAKGSAETLERELLKIKDLDISKMNTDEMKIKVKELTTVIQNEADGWQSILSEIFAKEADGTFKNSVEEQLKLLKTKMDELAEAKKKLMGDDEMYSDVIGATETGLIFKDDVLDKIKAYNKLVDDNDKKLKQLGIHARDVSEALNYAIGGDESVSDELAGKSLNEQVALLSEYSYKWQKFITKLSETNPKAMNIANIWKANAPSKKDIEDSFEDAEKAMDNAFALKGEDINNLTERGRQAVYGFVDGIISETATQRPKMQQWLYDWWTGAYNIPRVDLDYIVPSQITGIGTGGDTGGSKKDAVAEMWKKRAAEIEKAVKIYDKWKAIEGKLLAENRVKASDEFANLFSGAYGFNLDLESPTDAYEYIQKLLDSSKEKQKELNEEQANNLQYPKKLLLQLLLILYIFQLLFLIFLLLQH
jgi:tape measure domain-containing protein